MNKICGIYKITSPTSKIYIGQSNNICYRIYFYKNIRCKGQPKLYNSIIRYGWNAHKFEIIHECSEFELNDLEKYYIKLYNTFDTKHGMNLTNGGRKYKLAKESKLKISINGKGNNLGKKLSNDHKLKIGESHKGKKHSEEHKQKISESRKGKKQSEETKLKIGAANKIANLGKKLSEETKLKIGESNRGKKQSEETKQKISKSNKGKKRSEEHKQKISESNKHRIITEETRIKLRNRIYSEERRAKISNSLKNNKRNLGKKATKETKELLIKLRTKTYEIYNQNNELLYKFRGNIRTELKELKLPKEPFCNTYKNNTKINGGQYKGWYIIKL